LIKDGSDGNLLLRLLVKTLLGETSVLNGFVWSVAISAPSSLSLVSRLENSDSARINSLFSAEWDRGFQWTMRYQFICSVILWESGFTVVAVVEVVGSSAQACLRDKLA
jgi:hypothetical protein